ncbi:ribonuclease E inhibitor RraB [Rhizobacter sp. Root1221]|uniref:ribonuclease E inhibitor RraB n=1 Tax=Rhizobacter sp. Root1221 TaxID=1736433 RepID=UPI0006FF2ADC|nr:ribonuclease E inhibitor RraB [Rhizobacter sp. Root1221]KQV94564.1 hypothetical protein ASC87_26060 [Rhizobacter sp. Root1221]
MISLQSLHDLFENMRSAPQVDVSARLLWGYFFFGETSEPLELLAEELERLGYTVVRLELTDDEFSYVLHVELIEHHTPQSLFDRNSELEALAAVHEGISYDGMDVGPVS